MSKCTKRYIRLKDNTIVDLKAYKEKNYASSNYVLHEDKELIGILDTDDNCIVDYFYKHRIIAKSDDINGLIMADDLVKTDYYKTPLLVIKKSHSKKFNADYLDLTLFKFWLDKNEDHKIMELYIKQDDNYILIWSEERGLI